MPNKKFPKLAVLSLLGVLALASCGSEEESADAIYAKPHNYNDAVITITDAEGKEHSKDIYNNIMKIIVDAMHDGEAKTRVLEKVLVKYAESIYGSYDKVTAKDYGDTYITLSEAYADATTASHEVADMFIREHKVYWKRDADGKHIDDDDKEVDDTKPDWPVSDFERKTLESKFEAIELRVKEALYSKVTGSSATSNNFFDEYEYVKSLYKDSDNKVDFASARDLRYHEEGGVVVDKLPLVLVDYALEKKDLFITDTNPNGLLHKDFYQKGEFTYIQDKIIPDVYKDLLVEQYLLDEQISVVRDSRARKINVLKLERYSDFTNNADALAKDLINRLYYSDDVVPSGELRTDPEVITNYYDQLFDAYATINKGQYDVITAAQAKAEDERTTTEKYIVSIMANIQATGSDIYKKSDDGDFYENTKYGDLMTDYNDFLANTTYDDYDATLADKFTDKGKISPEEGLRREKVKLDQNKTIFKDWYIQSSQPSLDSAGEINKRLFTATVGNAKMEVGDGTDPEIIAENYQTLKTKDRFQEDANHEYKIRTTLDVNESKYLCSINGAYFLKFDGNNVESNEPFGGDIMYRDSDAYYVVQVIEAVRDNKLRSKGDYSYSTTRGTKVLQEIIEEVSKKVAETGSYSSLSKEYWLKKMSLFYHDQVILNYFKDNYPDLFK